MSVCISLSVPRTAVMPPTGWIPRIFGSAQVQAAGSKSNDSTDARNPQSSKTPTDSSSPLNSGCPIDYSRPTPQLHTPELESLSSTVSVLGASTLSRTPRSEEGINLQDPTEHPKHGEAQFPGSNFDFVSHDGLKDSISVSLGLHDLRIIYPKTPCSLLYMMLTLSRLA